jgi:hypothetical protein
LPIDPPQVDEQTAAMLQEWYREVIKNSVYFEATNVNQFLTVWMR